MQGPSKLGLRERRIVSLTASSLMYPPLPRIMLTVRMMELYLSVQEATCGHASAPLPQLLVPPWPQPSIIDILLSTTPEPLIVVILPITFKLGPGQSFGFPSK